MSDSPAAVWRRIAQDVFNQRDLDLLDEIYAAEHTHNGRPSTPAANRRIIGAILKAFPDGRMTVEDQLTIGDQVVSRWMLSGTDSGGYMGNAPTGRRIEVGGISICRVVEGKITEEWEYFNEGGLLRQLGAI
jgi:predicted ester cyclase